MSTLRGNVWRDWPPYMDICEDHRPWRAEVGVLAEGEAWPANWVSVVGRYESQPEALAAVCQRLKDEALVGDIVRQAEGKEAGA
ncbi:hypothetical protein ACIRON_02830 [Nocardioides sp. NPDC101246]|uniref:hypothetical protein n=1 Tax=Nocardioides sp. NPDC101246 TaxID=3364336 RepID=UPI0037FBBA2F